MCLPPPPSRPLQRRGDAADAADSHRLPGKLPHVRGAPAHHRARVGRAVRASVLGDVLDQLDHAGARRAVRLTARRLQAKLETAGLLLVLVVLGRLAVVCNTPNTAVDCVHRRCNGWVLTNDVGEGRQIVHMV